MRAPSYRIMRQSKSGRRTDVISPLTLCVPFSLHAPTAELALANAKALGIAGSLVAIPEAN